MVQRRTKSPTASSSTTQISFLPVLFPGEDWASYAALQDALLHDLAPQTAYERLLVEDLVNLEWEKVRHRELRDHLILDMAEGFAVRALQPRTAILGLPEEASEEAKQIAKELVGADAKLRAEAATALQESGEDPKVIMARAYKAVSDDAAVHERKLAEIELRRRRLMRDYNDLRASRATVVTPAAE